MDPYAILRVRPASVSKESDIPKLKERAFKLSKEYMKVGKQASAREVEKAYMLIKEQVLKKCGSAGAQAFSKPLVNRPNPTLVNAERVSETMQKVDGNHIPKSTNHFALTHFLKAQGPLGKEPQVATDPQNCPSTKSREAHIKEKLVARRQAVGSVAKHRELEAARRQEAIRDKLSAKRARTEAPAPLGEATVAAERLANDHANTTQNSHATESYELKHSANVEVALDQRCPVALPEVRLANRDTEPLDSACSNEDVNISGGHDAQHEMRPPSVAAVGEENGDNDEQLGDVDVSYF